MRAPATLAFARPTLAPPPYRFERCALVGSSSSLRGMLLGTEIDAHDTVIRINRLPTRPFEADVGARTDVYFTRAFGRLSTNGYVPLFLGGDRLSGRLNGSWCDFVSRKGCPFGALVISDARARWADAKCQRSPQLPGASQAHSGPADAGRLPVSFESSTIFCAARLFRALGPDSTAGFSALLTFAPICTSIRLFGFGGGACAAQSWQPISSARCLGSHL